MPSGISEVFRVSGPLAERPADCISTPDPHGSSSRQRDFAIEIGRSRKMPSISGNRLLWLQTGVARDRGPALQLGRDKRLELAGAAGGQIHGELGDALAYRRMVDRRNEVLVEPRLD